MNENEPVLTKEMCKVRRERLWDSLPDTVDWVVVGNPKHICYLSGFLINPVSLSFGERAFLIAMRSGETVLIADNHSMNSAEMPHYADRNITVDWYNTRQAVRDRTRLVCDALSAQAASLPSDRGLTETEWVPGGIVNQETAGFSLAEILLRQRRRKDPDELAIMKRIARAGEAGHKKAFEIIRPGMSEMDIYREIESEALKELGHIALVYGDFRAVNAENPQLGGAPTGYVCREGDLFILDYSIVFRGYRSDFTNTIAVGSPTPDQIHVQEACLKAMEAAENLLRPGQQCSGVYAAMQESFAQDGLGDEFGGHAGHGLGMAHPEAPCFGPLSGEVLTEGEVVTLEPAAYKKGVGGVRIERNYHITGSGFEILTGHELTLG